MKKISIFNIVITSILVASCSHKQPSEQTAEVGNDLISITADQFRTGGLIIGEPVKLLFEEIVKCNGRIVTLPSGDARISTPVQGLVKNIYCSGGQKVGQGQTLFEMSGNEFIELQKDLAETASQLKRLKSEYERILALYSEKIGTEKDLILAESEFKASNANYSALKMKIQKLGLDITKIENGDFYESFSLKSPINGFITSVNVSIGQYADLQTILAEVFDVGKLQLKLDIFEKDFGSLKEGDIIRFNLLGDTGRTYNARLKSTGKNVQEDSKTITCYADIDELNSRYFVNNAFVEATIVTKNDTVNAVPEESVIRAEGNNYFLEFVKEENSINYLKRVKADIGRLNNGYVEIKNIPDNLKLITKGAYNIGIE